MTDSRTGAYDNAIIAENYVGINATNAIVVSLTCNAAPSSPSSTVAVIGTPQTQVSYEFRVVFSYEARHPFNSNVARVANEPSSVDTVNPYLDSPTKGPSTYV